MAISAVSTFSACYGYGPQREYFSPGRVNLIGEYTDIAGGHVLPMAIQLGIAAAVAERSDRLIRIYSLGEQLSFSLDELRKGSSPWLNYVIGVFSVFAGHGYKPGNGFDIALNSDLPPASGLSSSASLEVLIGTLIADYLPQSGISSEDIVKFAKETENNFIGVKSGIMDQFACKFGEKGMAIMLDTKSLKYEYVPFRLGDNDLVIMNSNKKRTLADSKYNQRVAEMNEALAALRPYLSFSDACSISHDDFMAYRDKIPNPVAARRLAHLISEDGRVLKSAALLKAGRIDEFCRILVSAHASMRDDFEATGPELDSLVDLAMKNGAKGARMTGAGFGGCAIFIADKKRSRYIIECVKEGYKDKTGLECDCYYTDAEDGARRVEG